MTNKVKMTLIGVDGNAFSLMGAFSCEARKQGWTNDEIKVVTDECMKGDYDHLLCTLMDNIDDCGDEDDDYDDDDDYEEPCRYCGGNCPNDEDNACDGYQGDVDGLYSCDDEAE